MCGIAGYIGNTTIINQTIYDTLSLMKKRGPDQQEYKSFSYNDRNMYLLHSRLSIIDLGVRSNQPFQIKDYFIVFNGEIYNYLELKTQLIKQGVLFNTTSDTEVLLQYYIEYGEDCIKYF